MSQTKALFVSNILDLALSYIALLVVLVLVHPVLNKRMLELQ